MPLIEINHPETVVEQPPDIVKQPLSEKGLIGCMVALLEHNAEFNVLEAGFEGDITPRCFQDDLRIPPVAIRFTVDTNDRERGILTEGPPVVPVALIRRPTPEFIKIRLPFRTILRIPEQQETVLLAHTPPTTRPVALYLGGLVAHVTHRQAKVYQRLFSRR